MTHGLFIGIAEAHPGHAFDSARANSLIVVRIDFFGKTARNDCQSFYLMQPSPLRAIPHSKTCLRGSGVFFYTVLWAALLSLGLQFVASPADAANLTDVLTYHNDNGRTGQTLHEEVLTPASVNSNQFGKLWELPTIGQVRAEPLYAAGVALPGVGWRNIVYIADEANCVYAFDADSSNIYWFSSMLAPGEQPADNPGCFTSSFPQIGITGTPVIDRQLGPDGVMFLEADSLDIAGQYHQRLHALDIATGEDRVDPVDITAQCPGTGDDSTNGIVGFEPQRYIQRACLLLANGVVYVAFSAHCDQHPATSWLMGYDENTLAQTSVINLTPNGGQGSIWNSGGGPAADANGSIYVTLGNGTFDGSFNSQGFPTAGDYGNCFVKLSASDNILAVADYFAMHDIYDQIFEDIDLASGSPLVLPPMTNAQGAVKNLVVTASKDQNIYLLDSAKLGKFNPGANSVYQELPRVFTGTNGAPYNGYGQAGGVWGSPAYYNGALYFGPVDGPITSYPLTNAMLQTTRVIARGRFGYPGAIPSVSANLQSNGIVWAVESVATIDDDILLTNAAILHAYAATNVAVELYNSTQAPDLRDQIGDTSKFMPPMIASGRVYVGTLSGVGVFGLLDTSALTPIQQWRDQEFGNPSNVGAGADEFIPAEDGVPNLVKYALGLDPFLSIDLNDFVQLSVTNFANASHFELTLERAANPPDVALIPEISTDLITWNSGPGYTTTLTNTDTQLVILDNAPVSSTASHFLRILVAPNAP